MAEANRSHHVVVMTAHAFRNVGKFDHVRADRATFIGTRVQVLLGMSAARQQANPGSVAVSRMVLVLIAPVAEQAIILVCVAPILQLRPQVPVVRMMQEVAVYVAHLPRGPVVLELELGVVVADAKVTAGSIELGPWPSCIYPAEAVAV